MTASAQEVQILADQILELLQVRIRSGQLVIHFNDGVVMRTETNLVHRPQALPRKRGLTSADE